MNYQELTTFVGNLTYGALALVAIWGSYCVILAWSRIRQKQFRTEDAQLEFLNAIEEPLSRGDFNSAGTMCEGDRRAMCQLAHLAIVNRKIGYAKVRQMVLDRFQRDVLADLEHRLSWVNTVIKSAPMLGLFGTVLGMMGAFAQLSTAETVDPAEMARNIQLALITTAIGLSIAIPLILCAASIAVRIRKLEDLVGSGLTRFFEAFRGALAQRKD